ncbi:unnamed protein product [Linum tenue]|uniref:L-ascorbate peroxidase n=1 Tax=Linum tenue TaxID=586396 RepID=A0AAV0PLA0_9ROSI|nr:unnamed protein product [Linum tenue]
MICLHLFFIIKLNKCVRGRWHSAGTFDVETKTGGPFGTIRHGDELAHEANSGLDIAVGLLGPAHLRDVFYRMGLCDKDIVALSGGHTLGRCHKERSGFEGPWTSNPLIFDNSYFRQDLLSTEAHNAMHNQKQLAYAFSSIHSN